MRLAPTLFAAALAAVAVGHEWPGDNDWELEHGEREGHPVGQFRGDRGHGSKEASWWEKLQGKGAEHRKHDHGHHGHMYHARDAMIPEEVSPDDGNDTPDHAKNHHHHHAGKHHGAHHPGHKHGHKSEHHHHHKGPHASAYKGIHAHKSDHAHKGHETGKPWDKWGWFSNPGRHEPILPRDAIIPEGVLPVNGNGNDIPDQEKRQHHHDGKKHHHGHHEHHSGHHKGEHHHEGAHSGAHKGGPRHTIWGEHPHNEHSHFHKGIGHHKAEGFASPHLARNAHHSKPSWLDLPKFYERDTDEVGPENEFFDSTDFEDEEFDNDDDTLGLSARDVSDPSDVEEEADPNEVSGDEPYYFGDDGDDDILAGQLTDSPDDDDDDEDLTEADLDDEDEDDEDDDDDVDGGANDEDDDDDSGALEKLKRWAEVKKHGYV